MIQNGLYLTLLLFLGLFFSGCYGDRTFVVRTDSRDAIKRLDRNTTGETAQIKLTDQENVRGKVIRVTQDSTFWTDVENKSLTYNAATADIQSISVQKRNALEGFGSGFLIGGGIGAGIGLLGGESNCDDAAGIYCIDRGGAAIIGAIVLGTPGALVGLISGASTETTDTYEIQQAEPGRE